MSTKNYNTRGARKRSTRSLSTSSKENALSPTVKKRKTSKPSEDDEREKNKVSVKNLSSHSDSDRYCWKCHKLAEGEKYCSSCPRVFHSNCLTRSTQFNDRDECQSCYQQSSQEDSDADLSDLLLLVVQCALKEAKKTIKNKGINQIMEWPDSPNNNKLSCVKDFRYIEDKCTQEELIYKSHHELLDDVKWIHHNCCILYGERSAEATSAKKILDMIIIELNDSLDCQECYTKKKSDETDFFLHICKKPHPIIWAKVKGYSYWPAKCLKVQDNKAHVRFFQTHQIGKVPITNCIFMSRNYPSKIDKKSERRTNTDPIPAEKELNDYITRFGLKFGEFPYESEENTPFDFEKGESAIKELMNKDYQNMSRRTWISPPPIRQELSSVGEVVDLTDNGHGAGVIESITVEDDCSTMICSRPEADAANSYPTMEDIQDPDSTLLSSQEMVLPTSGYYLPNDPSALGCQIGNTFSVNDMPSNPSTSLDLNQRANLIEADVISAAFQENGSLTFAEQMNQISRARPVSQNLHEDNDIQVIEERFPSSPRSLNDVKTLLSAVLRCEPRANQLLNHANLLMNQFFLQFWVTSSQICKPDDVILKQENEIKKHNAAKEKLENEIRNLKTEMDEQRRESSLTKKNYEERLSNAEELCINYKSKLKKRREKEDILNEKYIKVCQELEEKQKQLEKLQKEHDNSLKNFEEYKEKLRKAKDLQEQSASKDVDPQKMKEKIEKNKEEPKKKLKEAQDKKLKEAKDRCSKSDCCKDAVQYCCNDGERIIKYCSEDCAKEDKSHHKICQKSTVTSISSIPTTATSSGEGHDTSTKRKTRGQTSVEAKEGFW